MHLGYRYMGEIDSLRRGSIYSSASSGAGLGGRLFAMRWCCHREDWFFLIG